MMTEIIDGEAISKRILSRVQKQIEEEEFDPPPRLVSLNIGERAASDSYLRKQKKVAKNVGIDFHHHQLSERISEGDLIQEIDRYNHRSDCSAILLQFPMPDHIREDRCRRAIRTEKDVDGMHPENLGRLVCGNELFVPCTALAVREIMCEMEYDWGGKDVTIVGHSELVGKPIALLLLRGEQEAATPTICHAGTRNLQKHTSQADVVISATGKAGIIDKSMIQEGTGVIDVGITVDRESGDEPKEQITGDVDFESVQGTASWVTPVPGGVGPVTVAHLMQNTLKCTRYLNT